MVSTQHNVEDKNHDIKGCVSTPGGLLSQPTHQRFSKCQGIITCDFRAVRELICRRRRLRQEAKLLFTALVLAVSLLDYCEEMN